MIVDPAGRELDGPPDLSPDYAGGKVIVRLSVDYMGQAAGDIVEAAPNLGRWLIRTARGVEV